MMHTFDILTQLVINHGYYNRNPFLGFRYLPTACTMDFMNRNDVVLVQKHGRTQIAVASVRKPEGTEIHPSVNVPFSLLFCVENTETYLENISSLPARRATESVLLSNVWNDSDETGQWQVGLVVEWAGAVFRIPKADWDGSSLPIDCYGQAINTAPVTQGETVDINAASLDEGVYQWKTLSGNRYFCNADLGFRAKPFALLHIATHPSLLDENRLLSPVYTVEIPSVEPFWEYRIPENSVNKYDPENLRVDVSDQSVEFIRQAATKEKPYLSFTSSAPIRLEDKKEIRIRLKRVNNNGAQDTVLVADLPFPSPATFLYKENGRITSPIFVYV